MVRVVLKFLLFLSGIYKESFVLNVNPDFVFILLTGETDTNHMLPLFLLVAVLGLVILLGLFIVLFLAFHPHRQVYFVKIFHRLQHKIT